MLHHVINILRGETGSMGLAQDLVTNPATQGVVAAVVGMILDLARGVGPRRAVTVYSPLRKALALLLHLPAKKYFDRPLVRDKSDSGEYILATDLSRIQIAVTLWRAGYRFNPTATLKFVLIGREKRAWEVLSVAKKTDGGEWHHVYVIKVGNGYELWGHLEAPPTEPEDHTQGDREPGDYEATVQEAFKDGV